MCRPCQFSTARALVSGGPVLNFFAPIPIYRASVSIVRLLSFDHVSVIILSVCFILVIVLYGMYKAYKYLLWYCIILKIHLIIFSMGRKTPRYTCVSKLRYTSTLRNANKARYLHTSFVNIPIYIIFIYYYSALLIIVIGMFQNE